MKIPLISGIISEHRWRLIITYFLFTLEMTGSLMRPFFLGWAVNDLIGGSFRGLWWLSIAHLIWLSIGTIRHRYDTRTYTTIYNNLVKKFIVGNRSAEGLSQQSAHANLSKELIDFMESDFPYVLEAGFNIIGSLLMLFYYDYTIVILCVVVLIPVSVVSYFYGRKMQRLNGEKNDELEKQVSVISMGNKEGIHQHFNQLRLLQIKISDKEAWNFGFIELMVLVVIVGSLLLSSSLGESALLAGNLISVYNYVLRFASGLDAVPYAVQRYALLKDISNRIANQINTEQSTNKLVFIENGDDVENKIKLSA